MYDFSAEPGHEPERLNASEEQSASEQQSSSKQQSDSELLKAYGYHHDWHLAFTELTDASDEPLRPARVVFESREHYRLLTADGERPARLAGRLREGETLPAVGDWVAVLYQPGEGDGVASIRAILPRRTRLSRKVAGETTREQVVAANIDLVFLVMGLDGDFNLRRLERFAVMAWESGADPVVVLTKADLADDPVVARLDAQASAPGVPVHVVSSLRGEGLEPLQAHLEAGRTVALIGSSGVGKSTLINRLCGREVMRTGAVRDSDDRGRHTTTHRQVVRLPGGALLVDNPGVREIQLWAEDGALGEAFDDIESLAEQCRFGDCRHEDEPGCAVVAALAEGSLDPARLEHWRSLEKELRHLESRKDVAARRRQDKKLGKLYKSVQQAKRRRQNRGR